ncbi:methyltransferase domain-containing protein [uncultured Draconibacterium sp.]|uniref:class I SAM-dependent methyltransferase n=1 Tax=uncultured Draconibacterium sp. TaxID=1573823 RepID=UPI002AA6E7F8|nr:methyltransferase domain-containing protein [uncultured Draconibacterium sp.]
MAERAHPKEFKYFLKSKVFGLIPYYKINPYRKAVFWRYKIARTFCNGKRVLDIPCGMGWGTSLLNNSKSITGIDISEEAINEAKNIYGSVADFRVGDMASINFDSNSFDTIVCLEGFEHVPEDVGDSFLIECSRLVPPKGILVLSTPYPVKGEHSGNPYHIKEYKPVEVREKMIKNGFRVVKEKSKKVDNVIMTIFISEKE